jgi:ABC-type glycerol-3-phosphate transport system permease component
MSARERSHPLAEAARVAFLLGVCAFLALPFYWMLQKSLAVGVGSGGGWWPGRIDFGHYAEVFRTLPIARFYFNTAFVSTAAATIQVGLALPMAYAFARLQVPGVRWMFLAVISTMLVPDEVKLIPNYLLVSDLGWIDTYTGLIVPVAAHAFPVFVLHEHLRRLPRETFEAAALDGASHLTLIRSIVVPQSGAILAALWIVALLGRWNDYLWPLVVVDSEDMQTLSVALAYLKDAESAQVEWGMLMAAAALSGLPLALLFGALQRQFMRAAPR